MMSPIPRLSFDFDDSQSCLDSNYGKASYSPATVSALIHNLSMYNRDSVHDHA